MPQSSRLLGGIPALAGYVIAYAVMRSLGASTNIKILAGTLAGLLVTLVPFFLARRKGLLVFGQRCLLAGGVVGAIGGALLAAPLAIILTIIVSRKQPFVHVPSGPPQEKVAD
jgi:hypothetical protein